MIDRHYSRANQFYFFVLFTMFTWGASGYAQQETLSNFVIAPGYVECGEHVPDCGKKCTDNHCSLLKSNLVSVIPKEMVQQDLACPASQILCSGPKAFRTQLGQIVYSEWDCSCAPLIQADQKDPVHVKDLSTLIKPFSNDISNQASEF